jgi:hypothetical protein
MLSRSTMVKETAAAPEGMERLKGKELMLPMSSRKM